MFVYTYFLRASLDNVCSLDLPYCTVYNTTESPSEYWRIMSGRKQFNMASWLKPPNPTITQGLIQCQWCDLKLRRSAQGYAIDRKVHVENRDPLRKKLKFGKVKLRTPDACTTGTNPKRYYVLQYTCIDSMIVLMLTLVLYVIRYHVRCLFILTFYARPSSTFALSMNLCHPYQGWELGVCERGFSRVSRFFEDPLGRFIWVQFGVMYTWFCDWRGFDWNYNHGRIDACR